VNGCQTRCLCRWFAVFDITLGTTLGVCNDIRLKLVKEKILLKLEDSDTHKLREVDAAKYLFALILNKCYMDHFALNDKKNLLPTM